MDIYKEKNEKKTDWLELGEEFNEKSEGFRKSIDKRFKKNIYDSKKGKILLDLQRTFKGDDRFHLDKKFENDVDFEKLPNSVKLANMELQYDLEDVETEPKPKKKHHDIDDVEQEKDGQLKILKQMFPKERIKKETKKTTTFQNLIVARFDPKQVQCKKLIITENNTTNKGKDKKNKRKLGLESGIDKKKKNLMKAEAILKRKIQKPDGMKDTPTKKIKKIDYQAWKKLIQNDNEPMTLFSK